MASLLSNFSSMSMDSSANLTPKYTLLKSVLGAGLGIEYCSKRSPSMYGPTVSTLHLWLKNHSNRPINNVSIGKLTSGEGKPELIPFPEIAAVPSSSTIETELSLKFTSATAAAKFEICTDQGSFPVTLTPNYGDLVRASSLSEGEFDTEFKKHTGMHVSSEDIFFNDVKSEIRSLSQKVLACAYLSPVVTNPESGTFKFCGRTNVEDVPILLLIQVDTESGKATLSVNSENLVLNQMLAKTLKQAILS